MLSCGRTKTSRFIRQAWVPMRDGTRLATSIVLPEADGRYPVVLQRTPYSRLGLLQAGEGWAHNGYVFVAQDTRGRYDSDGDFTPFLQEFKDTPDTVAWLRQQPWCNGQVGMMGPSYLGWVQYLGVTGGAGPVADALMPMFLPGGTWQRGWYAGGPLSLFLAFWWLCFDVGSRTGNGGLMGLYDLEELFRRLPLEDLDVSSGAGLSRFWRETMAIPGAAAAVAERMSIRNHYHQFTMPTFQVAGWYDYYPAEAFDNWNRLVAAAPTPELAARHTLLVGPWGHHHGLEPTPDGRRALDFGPDSGFDGPRLARAWFDRTLKDGPSAGSVFQPRPLRIFVMGSNMWRDEDEWPLARTQYQRFFLRGDGHANTLHGDGRLELAAPGTESPDHYVYDPANPVPTRGGNHSIGPWNDAYKDLVWCGPCDQRPNEARPDVLVYSSLPLERDLEVTGPVKLQLWAASSARDTDFVGRLVDVFPDGRAINITEGVVRARYRAGERTRPELLEPGQVCEYAIDLQCTSRVFAKGHCLRLEVTSSCFPLWDRNLNTGEDPNRSRAMQVAQQTVLHDAAHPSCLLLPTIPCA